MIEMGAWAAAARLGTRLASELAEFSEPAGAKSDVSASSEADAQDQLSPADALLADFDARILDEDLRQATRSRFVSQHYADSVEAGVKCLNTCVRARSGRSEDGDGLMTVVFSPQRPILRINPGRTKSDESAQRGHMHLCQGVIGAWRNPRAHTLLHDSPERALMMLETINDLIVVTKQATRTRRPKANT